VGADLELIVTRFNAEEGLYELSRPTASVAVGNWEDVRDGQIVEVTVTGSNKGGLECQIAGLRGFIPLGQLSIYRVERPEDYVGQRLACVVTEANRDRQNLVLSHRAVMERGAAGATRQVARRAGRGATSRRRRAEHKGLRRFCRFGRRLMGWSTSASSAGTASIIPAKCSKLARRSKSASRSSTRTPAKSACRTVKWATIPWNNVQSKYYVERACERHCSRG